ncbi:efflux RND transporter permease subunit [Megalodesulfovibrio gigas]|uniref:Putative acriflavin resistance protein n=1 Tax=Megalodesulfovibrio gigas (strain ATCC 19364 / DSM 1382 / NCIMB 9332 / VKM B-1759) TaxID=1121448 RepID=T2G7M1_MEGG1|nr:efflux RND transporter permease subunit [Megalodesulfovibrio gigas]AGW12121.1 putative acriflavin resistance protein [Megalodesulfovibrio gigas DSM 1382 = ATCC 19364]
MELIRTSIQRPVSVFVGVILAVLFGVIALGKMPIQLSPTVIEPEITVTTTWTGATPYEVEREIIEEQEKVLKGIPGLMTMESDSFNGQGEITLRFRLGTDIDSALLRVSNKLNEVPQYPDNVDRPVISATGAATSPIIWMVLKTLPENTTHIDTYRTYFEEEVRQYLERVPGVADLFVFGGTEREMHVVVDPVRLAAHQLTIEDIINVLRVENINVSAGNLEVGRRDFRIRTTAQYQSPKEIEGVVITSTGQRRISIADVAEVRIGYEKPTVAMLHDGTNGIVCGIKPEPAANVLAVTDAMEVVVKELNEGPLKERGLFWDWSYDQRPYIRGAIDLVKQNILIGSVLAVLVLLVFLRSISATVVVGLAIPVSVIGTFLVMQLLGRTLNVVSLAGISFASGMLVDNAIVVLENIVRHRAMGKPAFQAAYDGASEVWGAVLASTLTTVAVFLPVIFMENEAGQLFKDITIAIVASVSLSIIVSLTVIPMFSSRLFALVGTRGPSISSGVISRLGEGITNIFMAVVGLSIANWFTRLVTIALLAGTSIAITVVYFPKLEYLPQGNRNLLINLLIPPPGLSVSERMDIGHQIWTKINPRFKKDSYEGLPGVATLFYVGAPQISLFGVISTQETNAPALIPFLNGVIRSIPGMYGVSLQAGIFESRIGTGRTIDVDFSGNNLDALVMAAGAGYGAIMQAIPGSQVRPQPSLELLYPEVSLEPLRDRLRAAGLTATELGHAVDVLMDGRKVGEFKREGEKKIDLTLKASQQDVDTPEALYTSLLATRQGQVVPVSSLATMVESSGINQIRHLERQRTMSLQVTPPPEVPLQQAMETIQQGIIPGLKEKGLLKGVTHRLSGAADKLAEAGASMQWNFLLALIITYLLMAALFDNFIYPFVIMLTVPLATGGGFLGLRLVNFLAPQPLDIVTMLGFVILVGVVVNNAILVVHQSLNFMREAGMPPRDAVLESVRTRLRPIYMTAATSVFGMLPLAVMPGPGSELYRGLGAVVLGGLACATVFTVFMVPALLMFFLWMEKGKPGAPGAGGGLSA